MANPDSLPISAGMKFGFFEWLGRVIMLVLAGMITLSIIGAIAAIPSGVVQDRVGLDPSRWPAPQPQTEPQPIPVEAQPMEGEPVAESQPVEPDPQAAPDAVPQAGSAPVAAAAAPPPPPPIDPAEWLEAITYILLALAGILVFATILLWRALIHWRRSADALEALACGPRG